MKLSKLCNALHVMVAQRRATFSVHLGHQRDVLLHRTVVEAQLHVGTTFTTLRVAEGQRGKRRPQRALKR